MASCTPTFSQHATHPQKHRPQSDNIHLLRQLFQDLRPFPLFSPLLRLGHRVVDVFSDRLSFATPKHPKKGTALFDQWLLGWRQDMLSICSAASHSIGTDASFKGLGVAMAAFVIQSQGQIIFQSTRPCSAHSSFDGELQAIHDAIEYMEASLTGSVVIVADNEAALSTACSTSIHSGFHSSLAVCKLLARWFHRSSENQLHLRWFPGHEGFLLNELADSLAGQDIPCVHPRIQATIASRKRAHMTRAVSDWRLQALPLMTQRRIQLKTRRSPAVPQLWGAKGRQFIDLAENNIELLGRFSHLISGHAPIGSYRRKFFPQQNSLCPVDGVFQDIQHVTVQCSKYLAKFPSFTQFLFSNKNAKKSIAFLKQNSTAVSFEDQPLDIDLPP